MKYAEHYGECRRCKEFIRPGDRVWSDPKEEFVCVCDQCYADETPNYTSYQDRNLHGPQRQDQRDNLHF